MAKTTTRSLICAGLVQAVLILPLTAQAVEWGGTTPSHAYQCTEDLISEIDILREGIGLTDIPIDPEPQTNKTPIHVYGKALEVMEKISRSERKLGMAPVRVGQIPLKELTPKDVLQLCNTLLLELEKMKGQLAIDDKIEKAEFVGAKTPANVYENFWRASYMLDGLTGPITSNYVFRNIKYLQDELELIATKLGVTLALEAPKAKGRKRPKEVAQQGFLALFKVTNMENRLGMETAGVPDITLVRITPSDVYDITNVLMAELVRVKVFLKIQLTREEKALPTGKRPNHAFAEMQLVVRNISKLIKAVAKKKAAEQ
ncbi:MAG: hypothetical protein GY862_39455 [Gammaproteobacteria bacterium]|nr:hypothetical protein [Gammaproteobacteria bacterium]